MLEYKLGPAILYKYHLMIWHQKWFEQSLSIARVEGFYAYFKKKIKKNRIKLRIRFQNKKLQKRRLVTIPVPVLTMWESFRVQTSSCHPKCLDNEACAKVVNKLL